MVETALELTEGRIPGEDLQRILSLGKEMLTKPVEPLPHVEEALRALAGRHSLMVITKGDLFDQESKLARSGLGDLIAHFEVVSEKDQASYQTVLERHHVEPRDFLMVGNSVRSDILPVLALGGRAVHIPYALTWEHERVEGGSHPPFPVLEHLGQLPAWLEGQD
jgi:putative hydrolase of the HAD superfamily